MGEMVERVMRAVQAVDPANIGHRRGNEIARAAIEAMRNPTAEMLYFGVGNKDARETWNLMIDAALK